LKYDVAGQENDGSSMKGIERAIISLEAARQHNHKCVNASLGSTPSGDKQFCYGANQNSDCSGAKADIPVENGALTCKDCYVAAEADVFYKLDYSLTGLHSAQVGVQDIHVKGSASLNKLLSGSTTAFKGSHELMGNTQITLIDELVGCPVCVKATIKVAFPTSLDYELDLSGQADITVGGKIDAHLGDRWAKYTQGAGWTYPTYSRTVTATPILNIGSVQAKAGINLGLRTSVQVDIDSIMWFHLNLNPKLPLTAEASGSIWPITKGKFCLKGDAELDIGHEADLDWDLKVWQAKHHWGPQADYTWKKTDAIDYCKSIGTDAITLPKATIETSTCAKPGDCGLAYQACCAGFAAKGFPCGCHLKDGTGSSGADCGTCGTAYSVCCAGFKAKGFPCTCDISSDGDSMVV